VTVAASAKAATRERVWSRLEAEGLAGFPKPIAGRIPSFRGAEQAAERLLASAPFAAARTVKINPDAPQRPLRFRALRAGKRVLVPTPRLCGGFFLLDPAHIAPADYLAAASISGFARFGRAVPLADLPAIDLVVMGSVAVAADGARVGKGEGYAELEYAILRQLGRLPSDVLICTTVHDAQVVDHIPVEPFDVSVDLVATPTRLFATSTPYVRPDGVLWEYLSAERIAAMPPLAELRGVTTPGGASI
jgi:5-formyltetrahydrofolate cyclo-ligase